MTKVILADDEEFVRYFLKSVMDSLFYDVVAEVEKGDELLFAMEEHQPNLLLLDINMPNLTGIEFLKEHAFKFPKTCIIILTSATSVKLVDEASTSGAKCFLRKDIPIENMINTIEKTWKEFERENR